MTADNAAKTQLKAQQTHHATGPLAEELSQSRAMKVERVQKPDQAEKGRIHPDERKDRRRRERPAPRAAAGPGGEAEPAPPEAPGGPPEGLGTHIDTQA